jgi:hypothetical protein
LPASAIDSAFAPATSLGGFTNAQIKIDFFPSTLSLASRVLTFFVINLPVD